jgi:hypothetical protein
MINVLGYAFVPGLNNILKNLQMIIGIDNENIGILCRCAKVFLDYSVPKHSIGGYASPFVKIDSLKG